MSRRLTSSEAIDLIETVFGIPVEDSRDTMTEAFVGDMDVGRAKADIESYLAIIPAEVDTDTISVTPDDTDPPSIDCVRIVIKTEG